MTGKKYGHLTVLHSSPKNKSSTAAMWLCMCDCGSKRIAEGRKLRLGRTTACKKCRLVSSHQNRMNFKDIAGKRFGRLTAVRPIGQNKYRAMIWLCSCDCGNNHTTTGSCLRSGESKSCGCLKADSLRAAHTTHGHSRSRTYISWQKMHERCTNHKRHRFEHYGGRGIKVCKHWEKFENFLADMGERPPGTSIDRHPDNDGNYEPTNCRWATPKQQQENTRRKRRKSQ